MTEDALAELGLDVAPGGHEHTRDGWWNVDCPFCSPGWRHYRYGVPEGGWVGSCWACGTHPVVETLVEASGKPVGMVLSVLREHHFGNWKGGTPRVEVLGRLVLPAGVEPMGPAHRRYLKNRKIDPDECEARWKVRGVGFRNHVLKWRLFLPVQDGGRDVSWTTRSVSDKVKRRYVSASKDQEAVPHKTLLFGAEHCTHAVLVCEGPLDALRVGPGAVATFGSTYTPSQVLRLVKYPVRVVCYDNEPAAQKQAEALCQELSVFPGETLRVRLSAKDPGSCGERELRSLRGLLV